MANFKHLISGLFAVALVCAPVTAQASVRDTVKGVLDLIARNTDFSIDSSRPADPAIVPNAPDITPRAAAAQPVSLPDFNMPALPPVAVAELPAPRIETPLHRLFCVEYARLRSGLAIFGDAKHWWERARNLYARAARPAENAVMVFSGSSRLKRGHVAVVTHIVSDREIRVDQANWQNQGEIDHATPVLDVSAKNDWSKVRVWNMASKGFGAHVYAVSGFIAKDMVRQASDGGPHGS